jgi:hypothetical protein
LVSEREKADPRKGIISHLSPLGKALLDGRNSFSAPDGTFSYQIVSFEYSPTYIEQQRILKKQASIQKRALELKELIHQSEVKIRHSFTLPELNKPDLQLAIKWFEAEKSITIDIDSSEPDTKSFMREVIQEIGDDYDFGKMLSARAAEVVAKTAFRVWGHLQISDISIQQIQNEDTPNQNWLTHDLLVDDTPYDVKNSRRPRKNPDTYAEHIIPRFKHQRGTDVRILGILSPYLRPKEILFPNDYVTYQATDLRVLGYTEQKQLRSLENYFSADLDLNFSHPKGLPGLLLPPWIFQYPKMFYQQRQEAIDQIMNQKFRVDLFKELRYEPVPVYLATNDPFEPFWDQVSLPGWQHSFIQKLQLWSSEVSLSLPHLFLTLITHFIEMARNQDNQFRPHQYSKLLYCTENFNYPLFIFDPLQTIKKLIDALNTIWIRNRKALFGYDAFKLQSSGILRGRDKKSNQWHTLLAYCGGWVPNKDENDNWQQNKNIPCGTNPLVLGNHQLCKCGRLICECGYCSESCELRMKRQKEKYGFDPNTTYRTA